MRALAGPEESRGPERKRADDDDEEEEKDRKGRDGRGAEELAERAAPVIDLKAVSPEMEDDREYRKEWLRASSGFLEATAAAPPPLAPAENRRRGREGTQPMAYI